ncbi:PAS domain S-box protein [Methylobacterium radiodurans]|uniref:Blue-light-activated histidine kinase n=1 Tax=Methylobacterium radiodurans TaxID=2202828 RepID=A0A2U8VV67_9HYPH|nr:PAS domain S-box protein [Methylobacterium radiodurans]AWN37694.1 histidine kinase [Methylobacterium radiodurans]
MPWPDDSLDSVPTQSFDDVVRLAAGLCGAAHAVICLQAGERLQAHASYSAAGTAGALAPDVCADAVVTDELLIVPDLLDDPEQLHRSLLARSAGTRFYAAVSLRSADGTVLGVLCVLDPAPRRDGLTSEQQDCLRSLARQTVTLLELRSEARVHRAQRILHERILDSAMDYAIIAMDHGGRITRWNGGAERILGWREAEVLGEPTHLIFTPEDRAAGRPETEMQLALARGSAPDERWHMRKDGDRFWASGELMPLKDENGTVQGFLKILRDRTQQRANESALRQAQEQLRLAVEATHIGIFDLDLVTGELAWDARVRALFGLPPDMPVSYDTFLAGLHPDDRGWVDATVRSALAPGGSGHVEIAYRTIGIEDGVERWLAATGQAILQDGRKTRFIGTVRDITEGRLAEQAIRETEERYRLAARATNDAIWDWNLASDHIRWNEAVQTLFGYAADEVGPSGSWWKSHIHPEDRERVKASIHAVIDGGTEHWTDEYRFLRADGAYAYILDRGYVLRDGSGRAVRMIGAMLDISARKRAEEHQRLLTGELQHRVKNTLALVQAIASQTLRGATNPEGARDALAARLISLGRAHDILTQASWTEAPIPDVVEGALCPHRPAGTSRIRTGGPNVLLAAKPALSLALALHELATNAAKYGALSNATGVVSVRWYVVHADDAPRFCLNWSELGGPTVSGPPVRRGFGSRLIERSFAAEVGGEVEMTYAPTGFTCRLEVPLASMQE